ncbi:lactate dehydrogenase-like 2-hydroxyacid dehydrogenase [Neorhizobium galegae]|uniref:2-hydroxyacid dehydrogenase n=1 Tax=Neorhizobium galegae TaxID=399 RepID=UPI00278346EE|nr:2-hydroxyacid dehydrogenase [Neorhizobium galegae]MDQ0137695.1 lactate dehydrogenase-like 2-hydroxyacid dehydrogenase [Neorhizobium galegae]
MNKPHILQMGNYPAWDNEALEQHFTLHRYFEADDKPAFLATHAGEIRGIATRGELGASAEVIEALPNLEVISVYGVGYDAVALDVARARGIRVTNTPDVLTKDVADLAVAMMLAQMRGMVGAEIWARSGQWVGGNYPLQQRVHGQRAGILGLGRIGYEVAKRLVGFDMEILYCNRNHREVPAGWTYVESARALAEQCDVLFVTLTGGAATRHIVDKDVIDALGPSGGLVNVSRASNTEEAALLDALETGALGWAALDVFEGEPKLNPRFAKLDNVLLQPHHGSGTIETRKEMGKLVLDNLAAHFAGQPLLTPVL